VVDQVLDAGGVIPSLPEQLHCLVERRVFVELLGPYHGDIQAHLERSVKPLVAASLRAVSGPAATPLINRRAAIQINEFDAPSNTQ
jgi:hypothetical protein